MHSRKTFQCKHDFWIKCKNYFCILCKNNFCIKCKQLLTNKSDQICLLCYFAFRYLSWKVLPLATPSRQCWLYLKHYFLPKMKILNISDFFEIQLYHIQMSINLYSSSTLPLKGKCPCTFHKRPISSISITFFCACQNASFRLLYTRILEAKYHQKDTIAPSCNMTILRFH